MNWSLPTSLRLVPMITMMGTIFLLSHQTGDSLKITMPLGMDKIAHMAIYGLLAVTTVFAFSLKYRMRNKIQVLLFAVLFSLGYGILDEFHQSFIPGRDASFFDILADFAGALLAGVGWFCWQHKTLPVLRVPK